MSEVANTAYEELVSYIFTEEDRAKFEWSVGAALVGGFKKIFVVTGGPSTGKSTILTLVEKIFADPTTPRVIVQHDGFARIRTPAFMFVATVYPMREGTRHLIATRTTGLRLPIFEYSRLVSQARNEIELIARHCVTRYSVMGEHYYDLEENHR